MTRPAYVVDTGQPRTGRALEAGIPGCQRQTSAHLERAKGAGEAPRAGPAGDQTPKAGAQAQGESPGRGRSAAHGRKKDPGLLGRGRGRLTSPVDRQKALQILDEGIADGARACELALLLGVGLTTLERWRRQFAGHGDGVDRRKGSVWRRLDRRPAYVVDTGQAATAMWRTASARRNASASC